MGAMFSNAFGGINWSDSSSLLKYGILGVLIPVTAMVCLYLMLSPKKDIQRIRELTITYDEEGELDEPTIIAVLDLQLSIGSLPKLREDFNRKRRLTLSRFQSETLRRSQLFHMGGGNQRSFAGEVAPPVEEDQEEAIKEYVKLVLKYDGLISKETEENLHEICDAHNLTREEIQRSQAKYINNNNSHRLLGVEDTLLSRIPDTLTPARAKRIKQDMEDYAYE